MTPTTPEPEQEETTAETPPAEETPTDVAEEEAHTTPPSSGPSPSTGVGSNTPVFGPLRVFLSLEINGNEIQGDSTVTSLDRENSIECLSYKDPVSVQTARAGGIQSGRAQYGPVVFTKRIDRSSPPIAQALAEGQQITEAQFRFFGTQADTGEEIHYYTVTLQDAFISSLTTLSPDSISPESAAQPAYETVGIQFQRISRVVEPASAEFQHDFHTVE